MKSCLLYTSTLADHAEAGSVTVQVLAGGGRAAAEPRGNGGRFHERAARFRIRLAGFGIRSPTADFHMFREAQLGIVNVFPSSYSDECFLKMVYHG